MANSHKKQLSAFETQQRSSLSSYEKYAKRIVQDVLHLKPRENLTIEAWEHELPFAREIRFQARKLGANVVMITEDDESFFRLNEEAPANSIGKVGKHEWSLVENSDAYVFFPGPADAIRYNKLDAKRRNSSSAYNYEWYRRATKAGIRGVRVRTSYATPARAKLNGFDQLKWYNDVLEAIDVDYKKIEKLGKGLSYFFANGNDLLIDDSHGNRLHMKLRGASPHLYSGNLTKALTYNTFSCVANIPGAELDIVPDENSVNGSISFDRPVISSGKRMEGLKFNFENGRLKTYVAKTNVDLFSKSFDSAKGDKDRIGAVVVGLTPKLHYGYTHDFHVAGAVTIGLGAQGEGDKNKTEYSFLATLSKATLKVDNKLLIEKGKLLPV